MHGSMSFLCNAPNSDYLHLFSQCCHTSGGRKEGRKGGREEGRDGGGGREGEGGRQEGRKRGRKGGKGGEGAVLTAVCRNSRELDQSSGNRPVSVQLVRHTQLHTPYCSCSTQLHTPYSSCGTQLHTPYSSCGNAQIESLFLQQLIHIFAGFC